LTIAGHFNGLSFSDDGQRLVVGSGPLGTLPFPIGEISVWRVADGSKLASWAAGNVGRSTGNSWFAATRDASAAAVVTGVNRLAVIDLKTGKERGSAIATDDQAKCFAFSPDGSILASGAGYVDSTIRLWDALTGRELGRLEGQRRWTSGLVFLADGKHLVSSCADQTLRLWDLETHTAVRTFRGHKTEVHSLALASDQQTLISGCKDGSAYVWNLSGERSAATSGTFAKGRGGWGFADGGDSLMTVGLDGKVARRTGRMFQEKSLLLEHGPIVASTAATGGFPILHPKRRLLAVTTESGKLQVWDWERRVLVREWAENAEAGRPIPRLFSDDGTKLAVTLSGQRAGGPLSYREWEIDTGRETRSHDFQIPPSTGPRLLQISSAGTQIALIASADGDESLRLDLQTGRSASFPFNVQLSSTRAIYLDGKFLVLPSSRGYVRIFDATTYQEVTTLSGCLFGAHSAAFSPDLQRLAIGSTGSEALTLWDIHSHERLLTLEAKAGGMTPTAFSPDGNVIAMESNSGATAGTLYFWRAPSWAEIEKAEAAEERGK